MLNFIIFALLLYTIGTNPYLRFSMSKSSLYLVWKRKGTEIIEDKYQEYVIIKTFKILNFKNDN